MTGPYLPPPGSPKYECPQPHKLRGETKSYSKTEEFHTKCIANYGISLVDIMQNSLSNDYEKNSILS